MRKHFVVLVVVLAGLVSQPFVGSSGFGESSEATRPRGSAVNRALNLDGQTGYVQVADSESLHSFTNAITIEVLFKALSFYPDNGNVNSIIRKNVSANAENFFLRFRTVDGKPAVEMTPGSHIGMLRAPYEFATGKWYHLAGTYDGGAISVFVNGVRINSTRSSGQMYSDKSELFIGKGDPEFSFGEYLHGLLDEIRIWNVARSQKEIQATMNTPLTGKEEGLVAYWNFDDGTAKDLSAHGNDGQAGGDAKIVESTRPIVEPEKESAQPAVAEPRELTTQERLEVLEALWTKLSEIYPALEYKGIYGREWIKPAEERVRQAKSDEEFYNILLELMATLNDTHTRILSYPGQPRLEAPPVELNRIEGKVAVIRAESDTGLSPGDVIVSVDGHAVEECLAEKMKRVCNSTQRGRVREACGQLLRGAQGTTVTVIAQGADGGTRSVVLRRLPGPGSWHEPVISFRALEDDIGYIRVSQWSAENIPEEFDKALETFKSTKGIVIDVRGNGGGNGELADLVNGRLTDKPVISSIDFWRKAGSDEYRKEIGWVQPRGPWTYKGRIAVLMDEASMSSCEHFVSGVEAMGNILLVGAPTNGAGGGPTSVQLSDGTRVAISRALGLRVNGIVFEGHGIPPHIFSVPTLDDLHKGRDAALDIAKDWILSGKDIPSRSQPLPGRVEYSGAQRPSETTPTAATVLPHENTYDTDLSITHLDIFLKTDFQSNNVDTVVKASVENFSVNAVDKAEFWVCPGANDPDLSADMKQIYFLDRNEKKELKYTIRRIAEGALKGWRIYVVSFEVPVKHSQKLDLEFAYTMKGKPDHSSAPIWQSKDGLKEVFLRGDFFWCPTPHVEFKTHVLPRLCQPTWRLRMEYPAGYVAVADGEPVNKEEKDGVIRENWTSTVNGNPSVFISKYNVEKRRREGLTLEIYAPDKAVLRKAANEFDDYVRILKSYTELYGDPGSSVYRIVGSPMQDGANGMFMGQVIDMGRLDDTSLVAHEMAHTWWGYLVYSYGDGNTFLREAMAEFSSMYARKQLGEEDWFDNSIRSKKQRCFCGDDFVLPLSWSFPAVIHQQGLDADFVKTGNYYRGPLIVNQIRLILGDDVFFRCLKAFAAKYKGMPVSIYDFIETINDVSGRDMTSQLKALLWSGGHASYRLARFESRKEDGGYHTKVTIENDGEYGIPCPLLLKMAGGQKREEFKVEGKGRREFLFTSPHEVVDVVIDPDLTTFQYHPQQKVRLWASLEPGDENWVWYGKSYMYYALGQYPKGVETISEYFSREMKREKAQGMEEYLKSAVFPGMSASYVFMRGVYYLATDEAERAEQDIKAAFPFMLEELNGRGGPPLYYKVGAISGESTSQYLALLEQVAGREFSLPGDSDARERAVEEWKQWWEKEGKQKRLDLGPLKERFEAQRKAFRERELSLVQTSGREEK